MMKTYNLPQHVRDYFGKSMRMRKLRKGEYAFSGYGVETIIVNADDSVEARKQISRVVAELTGNQDGRIGKPYSRPVTIRGKTYASMAEAAKDLGVSRQRIHQAVKNDKTDLVGTGTQNYRGGRPLLPITINGKTYPSRKAAAKELGLNPAYIVGYAKVMEAINVHN